MHYHTAQCSALRLSQRVPLALWEIAQSYFTGEISNPDSLNLSHEISCAAYEISCAKCFCACNFRARETCPRGSTVRRAIFWIARVISQSTMNYSATYAKATKSTSKYLTIYNADSPRYVTLYRQYPSLWRRDSSVSRITSSLWRRDSSVSRITSAREL